MLCSVPARVFCISPSPKGMQGCLEPSYDGWCVPVLPHVPHRVEQRCWDCSLPQVRQVSSLLCSEHMATAIPPSPVPMARSLPSCRALIDATAPSPRPANKHLYPPLAAPTLPAHRAAGKRAASWCQTTPAQLTPVDFGVVWCQSLLQLIFPLPGSLPAVLDHVGEDPSISEVPNKASGAQARSRFPAPSPGCWIPVQMLSSYLMGLLAWG